MSGPSNHKKAKPLNTKYILHNVELESVPAAKYLGVTIADDLSWSKHIDITTKKANLFADDCVLYRRINSEEDAHKLQKDLDGLQKWEKDWLMEFHPQKCQTMHITNKRKPVTVAYHIPYMDMY